MSEECTHNCETCGEACGERKPESMLASLNPRSHVKKVIAVVSGKGGVGKSTVTSLLAVAMQKRGLKTAILDADITGPSIPKAFHVCDCMSDNDNALLPARSENGTQIMSINLLLDNESDPVLWRGPILAGAVKQFWTDVVWEDVDYMFVDMPPGTGDVPLTVFQSLPINGVVIVTSPQEMVSMIVSKAVRMANMMHLPVLGIVENYSYLRCPDCGKKIQVFGKSHLDAVVSEYGLPVLARLPIDPEVAEKCDAGRIEEVELEEIEPAVEYILQRVTL
jgi:Mrp family chromosome partitioning ATPase